MCKAIDESFPTGGRTDPQGGFFVWWESKDPSFDATRFLEQTAVQNDIIYVPGRAFYPLKGRSFHMTTQSLGKNIIHANSMRLGFSYIDHEEITTGMNRLGTLLSKELD